MPRGGARANSGPAPDPYSFRSMQRRARGEALPSGWIVLPITGRPGPPPEWPLPDPSDRERELWTQLWTKPQATEWERLGVDHDVALYVRRLVVVEQPDASAAACNLLMRMEEALGLSLPGLQARKWQLGSQRSDLASVTPMREGFTADEDDEPEEDVRDRFRGRSARDRIAVGPGAFRRPGADDLAHNENEER